MKSAPLWLGRFVIAKPRKDGSFNVLFQLPLRLRPQGWSTTTPLPFTGARKGELTSADEVGRIVADAKTLYERYLAARAGANAPQQPKARSFDVLIATWESSQAYKDNKPRTNKGYDENLPYIRKWAALIGDPDPTTITAVDVETFLAAFDDRPWTRYHLRKILRMIMEQAVRLKWRSDNPAADVKVPIPKSRVEIWEQADVDAYAKACEAAGQPDVAAIVLTEWEIGQRLTDVILFRHGADYSVSDGVFRFWQAKTQSYVTIPVSDRLRALLAKIRRADSPYLFHDAKTGRPWPDVNRLGHVFEDIRGRHITGAAVETPGRHLVLRALRHSCVVQLARAGCEIAEICAITGHSLASATTILQTYLPRDSQVARNAQMKRGLIGNGVKTPKRNT